MDGASDAARYLVGARTAAATSWPSLSGGGAAGGKLSLAGPGFSLDPEGVMFDQSFDHQQLGGDAIAAVYASSGRASAFDPQGARASEFDQQAGLQQQLRRSMSWQPDGAHSPVLQLRPSAAAGRQSLAGLPAGLQAAASSPYGGPRCAGAAGAGFRV